ncbi:phosphoglycerate dehydrogenase [Cellulomonas hominis]|uniref:D-3-phosphoglycerate dehydrogenase n=1 Tax=Cellulomonas hominis TaxID=156981 RepID=A0A511FAB4_9CELL|nr:phosphoglycerate dehydrogenase [Cellulomonas hominis]MBB5474409.1 D-3-phosphoglycerate dehydrogenase [Cellulomonas hominis]MBU5422639.1 phosphoglycerate dehydrogenase [Cellulomonas hominis]NKY07536.1 phosphoglycerate dehydrogenase [Cellulomonas hominis]NKY10320.1 phosphoglycerate dehydrogenase [Cellulomonas hominis]GEL45504.1 D-3-phosphoglycerate dehydrogenase [Cellulomonas hominis]
MPRALLLENLHPQARTILESAGYEVVTRSGALDEPELIEALQGVQLLGIRSKTQVTEAVLDAAPDLVAVGAYCIGTNQIDLHAAASRGVAVFNAPFSNTRSVVEIALADIIALTRRLTVLNGSMHDGVWNKSADGAHEVRGRTLGIVGYGNIGTQLSVLAENLGMSVVFYDTAEKLSLGNARRAETLDELLDVADIVTLHVDGRSGNAGLFGAKQFARMREGAIFLNLSRGFVVDYAALRDAVLAGHVAGAAVDVFPVEPKRKGDPFESELRGLPNVILTPHTGGSTEEAQEAIGQFVSNKLRDFMNTGTTMLSVNLPNLTLEHRPNVHRLTYLHRNVPGVLAAVNQTLAEHGANIEGQLLATRGEVGYVVTDAVAVEREVVEALRARPETIRLRVVD